MNRRRFLIGSSFLASLVGVSGCAGQAQAQDLEVWRDAGCGCCEVWTERMAATGQFRISLMNEVDMVALKRRLGVPEDLASCHTASVDGFVIEGHVPAREISRLIEERPAGVRGLAVAGMPVGSPGMEMPDGRSDAFDVIAFGDGDRRVFAHYPASSS